MERLVKLLARRLSHLKDLNVCPSPIFGRVIHRSSITSTFPPGPYGLELTRVLNSLPLEVNVNFSAYISLDTELRILETGTIGRYHLTTVPAYLKKLTALYQYAYAGYRNYHLRTSLVQRIWLENTRSTDNAQLEALKATEDGILEATLGLRSLSID